MSPNPIARLLDSGTTPFGVFSGPKTPEQGARVARRGGVDFVFYCLEEPPFDLAGMGAYRKAMLRAVGPDPAPLLLLRIPPIRDGRRLAGDRAGKGLGAGAVGIVFPHVETADEALFAVSAVGEGPWPTDPTGERLALVLIEDRAGVGNAADIAATAGVGVVLLGPADLAKAYQGDAAGVERAIQSVLAVCKERDVPCGITAGDHDVLARLDQGFRLIIATSDNALTRGREAAGRDLA